MTKSTLQPSGTRTRGVIVGVVGGIDMIAVVGHGCGRGHSGHRGR